MFAAIVEAALGIILLATGSGYNERLAGLQCGIAVHNVVEALQEYKEDSGTGKDS